MDESFFADCEKELTKINLFFSQKIAEAQGKYHELNGMLIRLPRNRICHVSLQLSS